MFFKKKSILPVDNPIKDGDNEDKIVANVMKDQVINSPITGNVVALKDVKDEMFAQEILGKGVAVDPSIGMVTSPVNGKITVFYVTKHAIGILSNEGVELLIHVGLDTVKLEGKYFTSHANEGDEVKIGDLLLEFDMKAIKDKGYDLTTPIIVTNMTDFNEIEVVARDLVKTSEVLLKVR